MPDNSWKIQYYLNFIRAYRDLPALWDTSSKDYSNKLKRIEGYNKLLKIYKNIKPNASHQHVKKKINTIRSTFKKELKKMETSINSGSGEIFEPKWWCFRELTFLIEPSSVVSAYLSENVSTKSENDDYMEFDESEIVEFEKFDCDLLDESETQQVPSKYIDTQKPINSERKQINEDYQTNNQNELLSVVCDYLKKNENKDVGIAKSWSLKLARLKSDQKIWAEKFINDILTEGELGTLHRHSVRINDSFESK